MRKYILVVGATPEASQQIRKHLEDCSTEVLYSVTLKDALFQLSIRKFALIMMELSYVRADSQELLEAINHQSPVPILILYANATVADTCGKIGLDADDTLHGAFDMEGCITRAKSYMELYTNLSEGSDRAYILACGPDLEIDPEQRKVSLRGEDLELSQKQFDLLYCLASHPGQVLSKDQLFDYLWGEQDMGIGNSIALYVSKLRKILGETPDAPGYIQTVRGVGYRFSKE